MGVSQDPPRGMRVSPGQGSCFLPAHSSSVSGPGNAQGWGISISKCPKLPGSPWQGSASSRMQNRRESCSAPGGDREAGRWSRGPPEPHGSEPWEGRQVPWPDSLPCCRYSPVDQIVSYDNLLLLLQKHKQTGIREKDFNPSAQLLKSTLGKTSALS